MHWSDEAIVLSVRPHGETSAIVELLTAQHGRHLGLVHGGRSRRNRPLLQAGNKLRAEWRARLVDHLGTFRVDLLRAHAAGLMEDAASLAALGSLTELCRLLAEREPHPRLYDALDALLDVLAQGIEIGETARLLVAFELGLLDELGFGLDLSRCAATGIQDELIYVSPKTGRAVSREAGAPYRHLLLTLPPFLRHSAAVRPTGDELAAGFALTGYFLGRHLFHPQGKDLPPARKRFLYLLKKANAGAGDEEKPAQESAKK